MHAVSYCLLQPLAACSIDAWALLQVQLALAMLLPADPGFSVYFGKRSRDRLMSSRHCIDSNACRQASTLQLSHALRAYRIRDMAYTYR